MKRIKGWEAQLVKTLHEAETKPFEWGQHDCSVFACNVVLAITGVDLAKNFRGTYNTVETAYQTVKEFAGGGLEALVDKQANDFEIPEISPRLAQRGDVVLVNYNGQDALAIVGTDSR